MPYAEFTQEGRGEREREIGSCEKKKSLDQRRASGMARGGWQGSPLDFRPYRKKGDSGGALKRLLRFVSGKEGGQRRRSPEQSHSSLQKGKISC